MCRAAPAISKSRVTQHFDNNEEFFAIDRVGDESQKEFECPDTLDEMLIIVREYQEKRSAAIASIQQSLPMQNSTPTVTKSSRNDYNMFCEPELRIPTVINESSFRLNEDSDSLFASSDSDSSAIPVTSHVKSTSTSSEVREDLRDLFGSDTD